MNEVYAKHVGDDAAGALDGRGREAPVRRARRDRGRRHARRRSGCPREGDRGLRPLARARRVPRRRRGARRAARASSRRTPTSSSPASTSTACATALAPHGRAEELVVAGRPVGMPLLPARRGDPRRSRRRGSSSRRRGASARPGPGRHDFEIVVDPAATVEEDLGAPRLHVNAMARRLADGALVDPFDGRDGSRARRPAHASRRSSFAEDPLRLVRGLRFVSQLGLEPDEETLAQMREEASAVALVSGERIGGGLAADGMGELSKLLLGAKPPKALRLARDTGVLVALLPEFEPAIGFDQESRVPRADASTSTPSRSSRRRPTPARRCACGSRRSSTTSASRTSRGAGATDGCTTTRKPGKSRARARAGQRRAGARRSARLRYPNDLRRRVVRIVRAPHVRLGAGDALRARRLLARHGDELPFDLLDHREADLRGQVGARRAAARRQLERLARVPRGRRAGAREPAPARATSPSTATT